MAQFGPDLVERVLSAASAHDLFGSWGGDEADVERAYKRFLWVHPDHAESDEDPARREEAFVRLQALRDEALRQIRGGRYGKQTWTVTTKRGAAYELDQSPAWRGAACNLFLGERDGQDVLVKVARSPGAAQEMQNEARMIRRARSPIDRDDPDADQRRRDILSPYLPPFIESFQVPMPGGKRHRANAFERLTGLVPLMDVRSAYPDGVHSKHTAWMFRRLLTALGAIHQAGIVHASILPHHVLLHPAQHGVVLIDWKSSCEIGAKRGPMAPDWDMTTRWYPERLLDGKDARPEDDINMAARCMEYLTPPDMMPRALRGFYKGCKASRLPGAWELKEEYDELLERMFGPRRFVPFEMPKAVVA
jgi:hypothetical protein